MRTPLKSILTIPLAVLLVAAAQPLEGQVLKRLKNVAKSAAQGAVEAEVARLVAEAVTCAITDAVCHEEAKANGKEVIYTSDDGELITDEDGVPITEREEAAGKAGVDLAEAEPRPGEGAWANYDFVPGETVLFYEDYETDKVGDFPRRMEFLMGNWEIVEWQGRRLLRNTGPRHAAIKIVLPRELPERFTIEFDTYLAHPNHQFVVATAPPTSRNWVSLEGNFIQVGANQGTGVDVYDEGVKSTNPTKEVSERLVPVRVLVDGRYAKVYVGEKRVANVPNANFPRSREIWISNIQAGSQERPMLLGPIRIAEGGTDLYDKLAETGRVATRGILFAVNSATIRPESTPTLVEIGTMLQEHADLRLRIEGHTDSTGDDAFNLGLSQRRAEAVRDFLVETYDIGEARLEIQGLGETQPVDDNDTPEGQQNNRRVELVKLGG